MGAGTAGGTFRLFCRRMEIVERPSVPAFQDAGGGCDSGSASRELAKPLDRCSLFGAPLHAILLSFLDSGKVLGRERPRIGADHHLEMGL